MIPRRRKTKAERLGRPRFITKAQLAHELGQVDPRTIDLWVREKTVPPPHSRLGERTELWLREYFETFVETGRWPEEAYTRGRRP